MENNGNTNFSISNFGYFLNCLHDDSENLMSNSTDRENFLGNSHLSMTSSQAGGNLADFISGQRPEDNSLVYISPTLISGSLFPTDDKGSQSEDGGAAAGRISFENIPNFPIAKQRAASVPYESALLEDGDGISASSPLPNLLSSSSYSSRQQQILTGMQRKMQKFKKKRACLNCRNAHVACEGGYPCIRCIKRKIGHLCTEEAIPLSKHSRKSLDSSLQIRMQSDWTGSKEGASEQPASSPTSDDDINRKETTSSSAPNQNSPSPNNQPSSLNQSSRLASESSISLPPGNHAETPHFFHPLSRIQPNNFCMSIDGLFAKLSHFFKFKKSLLYSPITTSQSRIQDSWLMEEYRLGFIWPHDINSRLASLSSIFSTFFSFPYKQSICPAVQSVLLVISNRSAGYALLDYLRHEDLFPHSLHSLPHPATNVCASGQLEDFRRGFFHNG